MSKCEPLCVEGKLFDLTCATCPSVTAAAADDDIVTRTWTSHSADAPGGHHGILVCVPLRKCSRGERELRSCYFQSARRERRVEKRERKERKLHLFILEQVLSEQAKLIIIEI